MVFSAPLFLFLFLPIFFLFYYLFPQRFKNCILLIFSVLFYTWGAPEFIILFLVSIFADFVITRQMAMASDGKRRCWLLLSLFLNISLLAYFKYANFFVDNCTIFFSWLGIELPDWKRVVLPIGISFFLYIPKNLIYDRSLSKELSTITTNSRLCRLYLDVSPIDCRSDCAI